MFVTWMNTAYDRQGTNIIVTIDILGTEKTGIVKAVFKEDGSDKILESLTTHINWTHSEKIERYLYFQFD